MTKKNSSKKSPAKRKPLSKAELLEEMAKQVRVEHQKTLAKAIWPIVAKLPKIYDAQTAVNAAAGFIQAELNKKTEELKVSDLTVDLSKEKASDVKDAVQALVELLAPESATDASQLLQVFGKQFTLYSANKYLDNSMDVIKMDDFIA